MKRLSLAVVGAGLMGTLHARAVADCDVADLAVIVDPITDKAREVAETNGVPHAPTVAETLAGEQIDGYIVAVPDRLQSM